MCDQCRLRPGLIPIVDPNSGVKYFICVECASPWGKKENTEKKKMGVKMEDTKGKECELCGIFVQRDEEHQCPRQVELKE